MSKSLAERIGEHTRQVVEEREEKNRRATRKKVFDIIREEIREKAQNGENLFLMSVPNGIDISVSNILMDDASKTLRSEEVIAALEDIGFEIYEYTKSRGLIIPQENVSDEIQELLKMYSDTFTFFENAEKSKANADCTAVLKKLEEGEYEVESIDHVFVDFNQSSDSQQYRNCVKEKMKEKGFDVSFYTNNKWFISVIRDGGD